MSDLISRQAAIDSIDRTGLDDDEKDTAIRVIQELPSAQPEVIRCKDCEHWDTTWESDYAPNYHFCPMLGRMSEGDFYCSDAERRTDG